MGIPQVTDRIKEAPAHALRAVFSGFGQLLLAAERLRGQSADRTASQGADRVTAQSADSPTGRGADPVSAVRPAAAPPAGPAAEPGTPAQESSEAGPAGQDSSAERRKGSRDEDPATTRWRSLDQTGNVRILSPDDPAEDSPLTPPPPEAPAAAQPATPAEPAAAPEAAAAEPPAATEAAAAGPAAADLPVPGYDALSLPSLRARLRNLDTGQLQVLIAYEREHAGRTDVVAMFERRIAKLAGE
jgi:hypothetical protein